MSTQTHLNKAKAKADVEALRVELGAPPAEKATKLLGRVALQIGRKVFSVPQARAALEEHREKLAELAQQHRPLGRGLSIAERDLVIDALKMKAELYREGAQTARSLNHPNAVAAEHLLQHAALCESLAQRFSHHVD